MIWWKLLTGYLVCLSVLLWFVYRLRRFLHGRAGSAGMSRIQRSD